MRTEAEVRQRVRGLLVRELDRRADEAQRRLPHLCTHNYRHPLDSRKTVEGEPNGNYNRISNGRSLPVVQTIGLCMLGSDDPQEWGGTICEDPIDAQRCPVFQASRGKDELLVEFRQQLVTPGWVEEHLPEVASLLWALDEANAPPIPWWKRVWYRLFLRIRIEPVTPSKAAVALLTESTEESDAGISS